MKKFWLLALLLSGVLLVAVGCGGEEPADPASIARGGAMYDKWWKAVEGVAEPTGDSPLWAMQSTNTRSGADTWRCKECHGWDYKGFEGAYSSGSHFTGFPGVYNAQTKSKDEILKQLSGNVDPNHDFSSVLNDAALDDLANFIREGLVDNAKYINYDTKETIGADLAKGQELFNSTCAGCHGNDGKMIDFHEGEGVGTVANDNPWETLHKIRFGHPGTPMPSSVKNGWSTQDAVNVLGYAQTLPE